MSIVKHKKAIAFIGFMVGFLDQYQADRKYAANFSAR
jgi:hypothetical protein